MAEALEMLRTVVPTFIQGKAMVPRLEASRAIEPEEQVAMAVSVSEAVRLKMRDMAELEREAPVAELEHKPPMAEATEVPRLEVAVLSEEAATMEFEVVVRQVQFCACRAGRNGGSQRRDRRLPPAATLSSAASVAASVMILRIALTP